MLPLGRLNQVQAKSFLAEVQNFFYGSPVLTFFSLLFGGKFLLSPPFLLSSSVCSVAMMITAMAFLSPRNVLSLKVYVIFVHTDLTV